jgi:hypothetical protein
VEVIEVVVVVLVDELNDVEVLSPSDVVVVDIEKVVVVVYT